jgi:hypothetical protein
MSHDLYASWATVEISRMVKADPLLLLATGVSASGLDVFANRESGRIWPIPDGRVTAETPAIKFEVALEMKRTNEGLHGILTAIGQAQAYLHKGYSGSAIVIPRAYDSHATPGNYVSEVINNTRGDLPIGVFIYDMPDTTSASPFLNKVTCLRKISLNVASRITTGNFLLSQKSSTQWAHLREGSTEAFAFYKYLQNAKQQNPIAPKEPTVNLPSGLISAVRRINATINPLHYLSYSTGMHIHDVVWRNFWFNNVLTTEVLKVWTKAGTTYSVNTIPTELVLANGNRQYFFTGRSDSIKNEIVDALNLGTITEDEGWGMFARKIHSRAHSYREDIDSGLEHLGLIESDGKPSDVGYKFVDACERTNNCHSGKPWLILGAALLKEGGLAAFLHYIYKVSEIEFKRDPLSFMVSNPSGTKRFDQDAYLVFLRDQLANKLHVMNTSMARGGTARKAFQGEFAILRKFNFISGFRIGVGLEINWPLVQEFLDFEI